VKYSPRIVLAKVLNNMHLYSFAFLNSKLEKEYYILTLGIFNYLPTSVIIFLLLSTL
jgi:hypothetical protein